MSSQTAIAVPAALLAAGTFAVSAVLQQRAAREAPENESLSWRLIVDLLHRRIWLVGMGCVLLAYLLQAVAFDFAPVAVVEPVVGVEIVLALPLAARLRRRALGRREWIGAAAVVLGIGAFLGLSQPEGGNSEPALYHWAIAALPALGAATLALGIGRVTKGPRRATVLATAAGLSFGITALLTQSVVQLLGSSGVTSVIESWQVYALVLLAPLGFTVAQSAYQAGPLALSLPVIDSLEPSSAVVLAAIAFQQRISLETGHLVGELAAAAIAIVGIFLLGRSPLVLAIYEQTERERHEGETGWEASGTAGRSEARKELSERRG